jgi:hypothetical protein
MTTYMCTDWSLLAKSLTITLMIIGLITVAAVSARQKSTNWLLHAADQPRVAGFCACQAPG